MPVNAFQGKKCESIGVALLVESILLFSLLLAWRWLLTLFAPNIFFFKRKKKFLLRQLTNIFLKKKTFNTTFSKDLTFKLQSQNRKAKEAFLFINLHHYFQSLQFPLLYLNCTCMESFQIIKKKHFGEVMDVVDSQIRSIQYCTLSWWEEEHHDPNSWPFWPSMPSILAPILVRLMSPFFPRWSSWSSFSSHVKKKCQTLFVHLPLQQTTTIFCGRP